jgi:hypothetical protein
MTDTMRRRAPAILLLAVLLLSLDLRLWPPRTAQALSEWLQFALALGAGLLCGRAALRSRSRGRVFWSLIGLAMLFWAAGQAFWAIEELSLSPQWGLRWSRSSSISPSMLATPCPAAAA